MFFFVVVENTMCGSKPGKRLPLLLLTMQNSSVSRRGRVPGQRSERVSVELHDPCTRVGWRGADPEHC